MPSPAPALVLSVGQKSELEALVGNGSTPQKVAMGGRLLLLAHQGVANQSIAEQFNLSRPTILALRNAFAKDGIAAATGIRKRKRRAKVWTPELEQKIRDPTLKTRPGDGRTHWSVRMLARHLGISRTIVQRVWQRHDVQPHGVARFKLSSDPHVEEKVRDIVGLYLHPPDRARVLYGDEKSQMQALDRTAPILPVRPGLPERQTHDYKRNGTTTRFAAFNILNAKVIGTCQQRQRSREFVRFLNHLAEPLPAEQQVPLIMDHDCTHKSAEVPRWLKPKKRKRVPFHVTPTSSSCLNPVERFFALITGRMIRRGTFHSTQELQKAIYRWLATWNGDPTPFVWKACADVILDNVRRCKELSETGD
jgi:transposase